ncbi:MAG TPA: hypothetical protein VFQ53_32620 [Kofleriaceae bacterium]|nr:hypothetical protein [Kofleriaceae bacterium]
MSAPLEKPEHLRPVDTTSSSWLARRKLAAAAAVLGVLSFVVVAVAQGEVWATPDWRVSVPGFALTAIAALASIARREPQGYWLWGIGLALAGAAIVLGWFLMVAIIIGAAAILILILHALM